MDCLSAGYKTAVCIYPFFLLFYFSLGWGYCVLILLYYFFLPVLGIGRGTIFFHIDHVCMYEKDMKGKLP